MRASSATTLSRPPSFLERPATKCARKKLEKVPENFLTYPMHHAFSGGATQLNAWKQLQASSSAPCECKYCDAPSDDESIGTLTIGNPESQYETCCVAGAVGWILCASRWCFHCRPSTIFAPSARYNWSFQNLLSNSPFRFY